MGVRMKLLKNLLPLLLLCGVAHAAGVLLQPANTVLGCGPTPCSPDQGIQVSDAMSAVANKPSGFLVSTSNISSLSGLPTIDGVTMSRAGVVLLTEQTTQSQNGPWCVPASGAWARCAWYASGSNTQAFVDETMFIRAGASYSWSLWKLATPTSGVITIDTTATTWTQSQLALASLGPIANGSVVGNSSGSASGASAQAVGAGLALANGVLATSQLINAQTGTSYTVCAVPPCINASYYGTNPTATDAGALITLSNASASSLILGHATTSGFTAGFSSCVQNIGAGVWTITPTVSTINGAAFLAVPQNTGLCFISDGANYQVAVNTASVAAGSLPMNVQAFSSGGTWTAPAAVAGHSPQTTCILALGAGGSGASGYALSTLGTAVSGGAAGGSGAKRYECYPTASLTSTVTVTVGAGATGGASKAASGGVGNSGNAGGNTSFGSYLIAWGGGGGNAGNTATAVGGTGGGFIGVSTFAGGGQGGQNGGLTGLVGAAMSGGGGASPITSATSYVGGSGYCGGGGGGGGLSTTTAGAGGPGASVDTATGGTGGAATGANGNNGSAGSLSYAAGSAGGGGGANATGNGGTGGNGALCAGGGGGGASATGASGAGGNGGNGYLVVFTWY
jgi:hypothetical protein